MKSICAHESQMSVDKTMEKLLRFDRSVGFW
jgi:hypothetical protein